MNCNYVCKESVLMNSYLSYFSKHCNHMIFFLYLSINAFDYNCHVDLIKLLQQEGKLHRLRKARQKMSELFPLTEEIWLDWLKDEIRLTEDESDREKVYELFERAVKDYVCPEIWLEYVQYSIGGMGAQGGIERVRSIFERALTAVGLHMTKGASIWEAYREFEIVILSTVQGRENGCQKNLDYDCKIAKFGRNKIN
uniref:Squamous cell carcinoma antigen recognized by T cells 3 n=1 Tax=Sinocyclocheilus rhinocerous TaxID=307959 RepID=A0A673FN31_9TELE